MKTNLEQLEAVRLIMQLAKGVAGDGWQSWLLGVSANACAEAGATPDEVTNIIKSLYDQPSIAVRNLTGSEKSRFAECLRYLQADAVNEGEPANEEERTAHRLKVAREKWPDVANLIGFQNTDAEPCGGAVRKEPSGV